MTKDRAYLILCEAIVFDRLKLRDVIIVRSDFAGEGDCINDFCKALEIPHSIFVEAASDMDDS